MTDEIQAPTVRATITGDGITLNAWTPALIRFGPCRARLDDLAGRDVVLADLTFFDGEDGEEVIVTFVPFEVGTPAAEAVLERWAQLVGYRRVWFPGRVAELEPDGTLVPASVECPTCGIDWTDSGPEFWGGVRAHGWFPTTCIACGGSLPEWRLISADSDRPDSDAAARRPSPAGAGSR